METLKLGQTDINVSILCFGTDLIGSRTNLATAFELLDLFHEQGGSFVDTANFYAAWLDGYVGGESETTIGRWMKERGNRDEMVVATKLGFAYPGCQGGLSASQIEQECEKSLTRLQTDTIDLYYAHVDDPETPIEETMEAFSRLVQAGKVRALGASNLPVWRIAEANVFSELKGWTSFAAVEQRYTYLRPRHGASFGPQLWMDDSVRAYADTRALTLVAYSVLLQGGYTREDRVIPTQFEGADSDERLLALRSVAKEVGATVSQTLIAWMRQSTPAVLPIIAGSKLTQVKENLAAVDLRLSHDHMDRLNRAGNPNVEKEWLC